MRIKIIAAALLLAALAGCGSGSGLWPDSSLKRLDYDYQHGKDTRQSMARHGLPATDQSCADQYVALNIEDNDTSGDKNWLALRLRTFINGCMGRPQNASPAPSPAPSASPS